MKDKLNNKNIMITVIVLLLILGIGFSYAWWRYTVIQDKTNVGVSKCFSIELANQANEINLTNMYPITDEEGRKLTPYTFTLKNTCSVSAKYSLNMEMLEGTTLNSNYLAVLVNNKDIKLLSSYNTATTVIDGSTESRTLDTGVLQANSSKDYSISIWMDKDVTLADDSQNKVFKSKIVVDAVATETTLDKITAQLDTTGKCPTINEEGNVNVTGVEATDGYLCSAEDAYGTSYYYRGNVTNNYVKFADKYWRIIRINGDGSVRVIYDGTSAHANGEASDDRHIGTESFNYYWNKGSTYIRPLSKVGYDNAGAGYMYGNADILIEPPLSNLSGGSVVADDDKYKYYVAKEYTFDETTRTFTLKDPIAISYSTFSTSYVGYYTFNSSSPNTSGGYIYKISKVSRGESSAYYDFGYVGYGTSNKDLAQANINDSTIKIYLDNWYKKNILGTKNELYLADNIFCNDRSISSGIPSNYTNKGYGMEFTAYRWYYGPWSSDNYNKGIMLNCNQQNDAFTVSDTTHGNGALTYPIGLITSDEVVLAGGWNVSNNGYYLYSGKHYWTMSPSSFSRGTSDELGVWGDGRADLGLFVIYEMSYYASVRPVINIKPEVLKLGTGTMDDPYRLE